MEGGALYNAFNIVYDVNASGPPSAPNPNYTAQVQVVAAYNCPSDSSTIRFNNVTGYHNYFASLGGTSSQLYGGSVTGEEANTALIGVFNVSIDENSPQTLPGGTGTNPDCQKVLSKVTLAAIRDGSSNTAMFAETIKSSIVASAGSYPLWNMNVYYVAPPYSTSVAASGGCLNINPTSGSGYSARIYYRAQMYYRNFTGTGYYAHTVTPNSKLPDCGLYSSSTLPKSNPLDFIAAHIAARSYHSGGVNAVLCDGSVHFFKDSISPTVWRAVGTMAGEEVLSADQY